MSASSTGPDPTGGSIAVATGAAPVPKSTDAAPMPADTGADNAAARAPAQESDEGAASTSKESPTLALLSQLLADVEQAGSTGKQAPTTSTVAAIESVAKDMLAADNVDSAVVSADEVSRSQPMTYKDVGSRAVRVAVVASFAFSLVALTWAGTVGRGIGPPGISL